jgi:hypothetical protein
MENVLAQRPRAPSSDSGDDDYIEVTTTTRWG